MIETAHDMSLLSFRDTVRGQIFTLQMQPGKDALMNAIAAKSVERLAVGATALNVINPLTPQASVKRSFAYRGRMWMTALSLGVGFVITALNRPWGPLSGSVDLGLDVLAWTVFCAGAAIRIWASTYICARKSVDVVRTGPYSVCRNPLYWGTFLMVAAFPMLLNSPVLAVSMLPPIWLYLFAVVPVEEAVMASRHTTEYAAYCQAVSRWWPNIRGFVSGEPLDGQSIGFYGECRRLIWWFGMAVGFKVLFHFADAPWWKHPLHWW